MGRLKRTKGVAKYCSHKCQSEYYKMLYASHNGNAFVGIPTGTVGAINELRVSVDLLTKGYHVFRALSPACLCDLVLLEGRAFRVEVTTGHRNREGKIQYPKHDLARFDLLAVVLADAIVYFTDIAELKSLTEGSP